MAFGTGNHETTKLCLESIVSISETLPLDQKKSFLDVGCGSGILALTASKLGFTTISAIDNDADAIKVSIENSDLNGVKNVIFDRKSIEKFIPTTKYDVVVANIQSDILICYSSELVKLLNKKSYLILSGILKTENNAIEKHFKTLFSEKQNVSYQSRNLNDWNLTIIKLDEY
jgi:ribosomal protein L11 methyltransferase